MTTIIVGTGCTFKSTTAEEHLLEVITYLQSKELLSSSNPTVKDFVQISYNLNNMTANGSFAIPAIQSIGAGGQIVTTASEYLVGLNFTPGDGGTFQSASIAQYLIEILAFLQIQEDNPEKNPQGENNISYSYDGDDKSFTGTIQCPIEIAFNDLGRPIIIAKEYLL